MITIALSMLLLASDTTAAAPTQSVEASQAAEAPKIEKKICKREQATESRMGSKRICLTAAEWKERQNQAADAFGGAYK